MYFIQNDFLKIYSTVNKWFKDHELQPKVITVDNKDLKNLLDKYNGKYIVNIFNTSAGGDKSLFEASFIIQILTQKTSPNGAYYNTNIVDANSHDLQDILTIYSLFDDFSTQCELQDLEINIVNKSDYNRIESNDWEFVEGSFTFSVMNQGRK